MAAGLQVSMGQINGQVGGICLNLRNLFQQVDDFTGWLNTQNQASLVALGFSSGDAQVIISTMGNLATLSQVYQGKSAQATAFNYQANSVALTGGQ